MMKCLEEDNMQMCRCANLLIIYMLKFYKKYELAIKIFTTIISFGIAAIDIFILTEPEKRNFHIFSGVVMALIGTIYLFETVSFYLKKKKKIQEVKQ